VPPAPRLPQDLPVPSVHRGNNRSGCRSGSRLFSYAYFTPCKIVGQVFHPPDFLNRQNKNPFPLRKRVLIWDRSPASVRGSRLKPTRVSPVGFQVLSRGFNPGAFPIRHFLPSSPSPSPTRRFAPPSSNPQDLGRVGGGWEGSGRGYAGGQVFGRPVEPERLV
jgi:hypothetical protein